MPVSARPTWRVASSDGSHLSAKVVVSLHVDGSLNDVQSRQLESLIRLTEARARLDLREVATKDDAEVGYDCCARTTLLCCTHAFSNHIPLCLLP